MTPSLLPRHRSLLLTFRQAAARRAKTEAEARRKGDRDSADAAVSQAR